MELSEECGVELCAIVTNAIPVVLKSSPGLKTMADIEPITFFGEV